MVPFVPRYELRRAPLTAGVAVGRMMAARRKDKPAKGGFALVRLAKVGSTETMPRAAKPGLSSEAGLRRAPCVNVPVTEPRTLLTESGTLLTEGTGTVPDR